MIAVTMSPQCIWMPDDDERGQDVEIRLTASVESVEITDAKGSKISRGGRSLSACTEKSLSGKGDPIRIDGGTPTVRTR